MQATKTIRITSNTAVAVYHCIQVLYLMDLLLLSETRPVEFNVSFWVSVQPSRTLSGTPHNIFTATLALNLTYLTSTYQSKGLSGMEINKTVSRGSLCHSRRVLEDITNSELLSSHRRKKSKKAPSTAIPDSTHDSREVSHTTNDTRLYMQREPHNIDAADADDIRCCTDYVSKIYTFFRESEGASMVDPTYMDNQEFITPYMRAVLVNWLVDVHLKFRMLPETLYITVNIIDRYLEKCQVRASKLQLVGVSALLLASKYEEIYPPKSSDLVPITAHTFSVDEILRMEQKIAQALDYNFTVPTIITFLYRFVKAAHGNKTLIQLSCYLAERSLQEYSTLKFPPSLIAATVVHAARMELYKNAWSPTLVAYTKYDESDLEECGATMREYMAHPSSTSEDAVFRKYSGSKLGKVSLMSITI